ncbi:MAG: DUF302 domain-containing protein [Miltoncostaeaceae bacterium]
MTEPTVTEYTNENVDLVSPKSFDQTVRDLRAELGSASTETLMERLSSSATWSEYEIECGEIAGPSNLIEVAHLNWGGVLSLAGVPMKARCFVIGNPMTARKLIEAGGPSVGLYLPTKMLVFEDADGAVHVNYDRFGPVMARRGLPALDAVAAVIDGVLARLAGAAVAPA